MQTPILQQESPTPSHHGTEKTDCSVEESERELVVPVKPRKFIDVGVLGVTDYWMRFEWQHRGSPHVHGLAWLPDTSDVKEILASSEDGDDTAKEELIRHVDSIVTTL